MTREDIQEMAADELLFLGSSEGEFDSAIVGIGERNHHSVLIYDMDKIISILCLDGMSPDEAREHFDFNIAGSYIGPSTPLYMQPIEPAEEVCSTCGQTNSAFICSNGFHAPLNIK